MNKKISIRAYQWLIPLLCVTFVSQTVRGTMMSMLPSEDAFGESRSVFDRRPNIGIPNNYVCNQRNTISFSTQENELDTMTVSEILALADEQCNGCNPVNNTKFVKDTKKEKSGDPTSSKQQKKDSDDDDLVDSLYDNDFDFDLSKIVNGNNNKATQQKNGDNNDASNNTRVVKDTKKEKSGDAPSKDKPKEVHIIKKVDKQQSNNEINKNKQQHNEELIKEVKDVINGIVKEVCNKQKEKDEKEKEDKEIKEMQDRLLKLQTEETIEEQKKEAELKLEQAKEDKNSQQIDYYTLQVNTLIGSIDSKNKEKEKAENTKKGIEALLKSEYLDDDKRIALTKIKHDIEKFLEGVNAMSVKGTEKAIKDILNKENMEKIKDGKVAIDVEKQKQEIAKRKEVVELTTRDYTHAIACILIMLWLYQKFFLKAN